MTSPTIIATFFILGAMAGLKWTKGDDFGKQLFLTIDWEGDTATAESGRLNALNTVLMKHVDKSDLRRYDVRNGLLSATYLLDIHDDELLNTLIDDLRASFPDISVTFLDQNHLPSV